MLNPSSTDLFASPPNPLLPMRCSLHSRSSPSPSRLIGLDHSTSRRSLAARSLYRLPHRTAVIDVLIDHVIRRMIGARLTPYTAPIEILIPNSIAYTTYHL